MPLVVPGITSGGDKDMTQEWMNKLAGKKIGEKSDATVCSFTACHRPYKLMIFSDLRKS
jgi:hypothetical protein